MKDQLRGVASLDALLSAGGYIAEGPNRPIRGVYNLECTDKDGNVLWSDTYENVVTTSGQNELLTAALTGAGYTVTGPFMLLISSVNYGPTITTVSSSGSSYTTGTGALVIATAGAHGIVSGDSFTLSGLTGTGSFASIDGTWTATTGTTGTTINATITSGLGAATITGGNVIVGVKQSDTMASHEGWVEVQNTGTSTPPYGTTRPTLAFSAASGGSITTSANASFVFTNSGTVQGAGVVFGPSASATVANTSGSLLSAGTLTAAQPVISGNTLNVGYTLSL